MEQFDQLYLDERLGDFTDNRNNIEANFILDCLRPREKASIVDYCCGHGRHAKILAAKGYDITGYDSSDLFVKIANKESPTNIFYCEDLRKPLKAPFYEYGYCFFSSFGLYSDEENFAILDNMLRHISTRFLLNGMNREWLVQNLKEEVIKKIGDTTYEMYPEFSLQKSTYNKLVVISNPDKSVRRTSSIRLYSLHEYVEMLDSIGWKVESCYGSETSKTPYTKDSRWLTMVIEKKFYS